MRIGPERRDPVQPESVRVEPERRGPKRIGLGTAQFGLDYGISNSRGQIEESDISDILALAQTEGITLADTARAYGTAEAALGQCWPADHLFDVITKMPKLTGERPAREELRDSLAESLANLRLRSLGGLLAHDSEDLLGPDGDELWDGMVALKDAGLIQKIGASVYTGEQVEDLLARRAVDVVQVPLSLFDQRLVSSGHLSLLKDKGVDIHARSIFLQGLLLMDADALPDGLDAARAPLIQLRNRLARFGLSALEAAIGFCLAQPEIDRLIVGVTSCDELNGILAAAAKPLREDFPWTECAITDKSVIDPRLWPTKSGDSSNGKEAAA